MSRSLDIQIETTERQLDMEMLGTDTLSVGVPVAIMNGVSATWSAPLKKHAGEPKIFQLAIEVASGVGIHLLGSWLYEKLKGHNAKLRINRTEVEIEPDKIRVVIERIEKDGQ